LPTQRPTGYCAGRGGRAGLVRIAPTFPLSVLDGGLLDSRLQALHYLIGGELHFFCCCCVLCFLEVYVHGLVQAEVDACCLVIAGLYRNLALFLFVDGVPGRDPAPIVSSVGPASAMVTTTGPLSLHTLACILGHTYRLVPVGPLYSGIHSFLRTKGL
jgi:hypothetical protein